MNEKNINTNKLKMVLSKVNFKSSSERKLTINE